MKSRTEKKHEEKEVEKREVFLDADDISSAKAEINGLIEDGFLDHGPVWATTWFELELKWSESERSYITFPVTVVDELVRRARNSREAFELAKFVAASRIKQGVMLPHGLDELIAEFLVGDFVPESKSRGRTVGNWGRDFIVARAMQILESRWDHRRPNRRKDSKRRRKSISQIVHEALRGTEIAPIDIERIQKIRSEARKRKTLSRIHEMWLDSQFDDDEDVHRI